MDDDFSYPVPYREREQGRFEAPSRFQARRFLPYAEEIRERPEGQFNETFNIRVLLVFRGETEIGAAWANYHGKSKLEERISPYVSTRRIS